MRVEPPHHLSCQDPERRQKSVNQEDVSLTPNLILEFPGSRTMSSVLLLFLNHPVLLLKEPEQTKEEGLSGSCQLHLESLSLEFLNPPQSVSSDTACHHPLDNGCQRLTIFTVRQHWTTGILRKPSHKHGLVPQAMSPSTMTPFSGKHTLMLMLMF